MLTIPSPEGITFPVWADRTAYTIGAAPYVPSSPSEDAWQDWVAALLLAPPTQSRQLPDGRGFDTWQGWALAMLQAFTTAGM